MNKYLYIIVFSFVFVKSFSQSNTLTNSPYSLYGLGEKNLLNTGKTNGLGGTGIALPSSTMMNNLNPASYGAIPQNHFFFDVGINYQINNLSEAGNEDRKTNGNFSNIAFALPINEKSGVGLSLLPYTDVGYNFTSLQNNIEGSSEAYYTSIDGYGGINELAINYGISLGKKLRLGISGEVLFGKITEYETNYIGNNTLELIEQNYYSGFKAVFGVQYDASENISFGAVVNSPTNLGASQNQTVYQYQQNTQVASSSDENNIPDFSLPLDIGLGISSKLSEELTVSADYTREFWTATNQSDNLGTYVDRDFIGLGLEFLPQGNPLRYTNHIQYRLGMNYDSGNLEVSGIKTHNYSINVGLGLPLNTRSSSMFNLMYSYGKKGIVSDGLIQENYHTLSLNISLQDIWFVKRKFN
ncbi:hypothetical protein APR41_05285 [Salegentibacter salinarum]|uniref:Aromatic hydrocarbon degradation protein n=1 Tax=Salegentibacter salinarum TaxID=447422 RepID=A0A2N0TSC1_9FLAO|nr:hypothetical protein [Salegentibacter salinarum]PKD17625.1 hypothetical protein APR41_05285 [Salegentibacter salinarum]SKB49878.1 hypothetical protein SAMN05660903_01082 [Salegentibacter salinarum]